MSEDDFRRLLGDDVKPLDLEKRVELTRQERDAAALAERRRAASAELEAVSDPLSAPIETVDPMALLSFKRPGVQDGVFRNLRLGKYPLEARLDMHRMTVELARQNLYRFVQDCLANDVRSALITHGKGEGREKPALLKSCVAHWLPQLDEVLAFHTAQKQHGSYGATYVLLRKSERKKQETRERASKRRL